MPGQLRRLGTDTAIYGASTIVGRFLNFLLVPFYTNVLHPGEYGIVAYVYSLIAFLNVIYTYGMESAYFKYASTGELGDERQNFSTPFISLLLTSAVLSGAMALTAAPLNRLLLLPEEHAALPLYAAAILLLDTAAIVPFASLRMEGKAALFAVLKVLNIVVNVGCNLLLLLVAGAGLEGIFLSGVIASGFTLLTLIPTVRRRFTLRFSSSLYKALLSFGLPYVPAGLAAMVIQVIDRPILRALTNDATVGVYQANYRLGIFMMLIVSMFDYAWRPFFLSHAKDPDAKSLFARVLSYFVAGATAVFLVLTFFIQDLVQLKIFGRAIIHADYWGGLSIVPVVLLAYVFLGVYNNLMAGVYIEKKTARLPVITFAGAAANVAANFVLIPLMGMMGAAVATLIAYVVMAAVLYVDVQRFYPVRYEWGRLARIAGAACSVLLLALAVDGGPYRIVWRIVLLVVFCALLYLSRFFTPAELRTLRALFGRPAAE
ncbi:MAG: oligosaccharide flippase family protein [Bacteroidota bacterium]